VLDEAVHHEVPDFDGVYGSRHMLSYNIKNKYTRQIRDEVFHVYEFEVRLKINSDRPWEKTQEDELDLGFVKRGKEWYWRKWSSSE